MGLKLDLGCGQSKKEGFTGVDIWDGPNVDVVHDMEVYPWPFKDNSVSEVFCSHYVEHTPMYREDRQDGLIAFMNELYRVCEPGAVINIVHPYFKCERAFQDPTHRRFITPQTWYYFTEEWRKFQSLDHYPITANFGVVKILWAWFDTDMVKRSEEYQERAVAKDWDVIADLLVELRAIK